jgi:hypothetical protein
MKAPLLFFDTRPDWLLAIKNWAVGVPQVDRVWIFGSRATGSRTPKENPSSVPDLDIAYTLTGGESGELLGLAMCEGDDWRAQLQAAIPVPIDLQLAQADDARVWPAVLAHGVLVYARPA